MRALPRAGVFGLLLSLLVLASSGGTHALLIQVKGQRHLGRHFERAVYLEDTRFQLSI